MYCGFRLWGFAARLCYIASRFNKKFTAVRNSEKNHGKGGMIDGYLPKEKDLAVIIDDVLTSGSSIKETLSILKGFGVRVNHAVVAVKRGNPDLPIPCSFVFTLAEIVEK